MKIELQYRQLSYIGIGIVFLIINLVLIYYYKNINTYFDGTRIRFLSAISVVEVFITVVMISKLNDDIYNAFFILYICTYIFGLSQTVGWAFGFSLGDKDLLSYIPLDIDSLGFSIIYTMNAMNCLYLGNILSYRKKNYIINYVDTKENELDFYSLKQLSNIVLFVGIPLALAYLFYQFSIVNVGGYISSYFSGNRTILGMLSVLKYWFPIGIVMKYMICCIECEKNKVIYIILAITWIFLELYIGGRSGPVTFLLALLLTRHYFGKNITKKYIFPAILGGYISAAILNAVRVYRDNIDKSLGEFFYVLIDESNHVIGKLIGELGWNLSSLEWTMMLVDSNKSFRYGKTYLASLTAVVPNLGFWDIHPAKINAVGDFLQIHLNRKSGLGYTYIAESYLNFSWYGLIFIFFVGYFVGKRINGISKHNAQYNYYHSFIIIICIITILKSFTRSSFETIMREIAYCIIIIIVLFKIIRSRIEHK